MPHYAFDHIHHEAADVTAAVDFYKRLFGATAAEPFERGGATWVVVRIGAVQVTVTNRPFRAMELGRYQGLDHLALTTDDFDATLAAIAKEGVHVWFGPIAAGDRRVVFVDGPDHVKIELMEAAA